MQDDNLLEIQQKLDLIMEHLGIEEHDISELEKPEKEVVYEKEIVYQNVDKLNELEETINQYMEDAKGNDQGYAQILQYELEELNAIKERMRKLNDIVIGNHNTYTEKLKAKRKISVVTEKTHDEGIREKPLPKTERTEQIVHKKIDNPPRNNVVPERNKPKTAAPKKQMEYRIGGELFGVIGAVLILIALITLGRYLLPKFAQGLALYLVPVVFCGLYGFIKKKDMKIFADILLSIGVASAYIVTLINYYYMYNFSPLTALLISIAITILTWIISKKTENTIIKLISMTGFYISLIPGFSLQTSADFIVLPVCMLMIACLDMFVKTKENKICTYYTLGLSTLTGLVLVYQAIDSIAFLTSNKQIKWMIMTVLVAVTVIIHILNVAKTLKSGDPDKTYLVTSTIFIAFQMFWEIGFLICEHYLQTVYLLLVIGLILTLFTKKEKTIYNFIYIYGFLGSYFAFSIGKDYPYLEIVAILVTFAYIAAHLITSKKIQNKSFDAINIVLLMILTGIFAPSMPIISIVGFVAAILLLAMTRTKYELLSIAFMSSFLWCVYHAINKIPGITNGTEVIICTIALNAIIIWTLYHAKNNTDSEYCKLSTFAALIFSVLSIFYFIASWDVALLTWAAMAISSVGIILILDKDMTGIKNIKEYKPILITGFSIFYVLRIPNASAVLTSIILLFIAAAAIYYGFNKRNKNMRIIGLVLSLLMTCKLLLVDVSADSNIEKVVLFLVCGIIILSISFIYNKLEKKINSQE